jgi:N-formylglutamate amidohydrolase
VTHVVRGAGPIIATAIHDGHELRPELAALMALDEATRLREEDPFTAQIAAAVPTHLLVERSRFEVDLNRPREQAVYRRPVDAWGLEVWRAPLEDAVIARSLAEYDAFYDLLARVLREQSGRFVVLDIHSYNHRRGRELADPAGNPEINVGTGTVDRARWGTVVDAFCGALASTAPFGRPLDVRENVRFRGGEMSAWIHRTFPETGCCLALEFKKTFMDEWTGQPDDAHLAGLSRAVASVLPVLVTALHA